jgi:CS domain/Sel1 repeat
MPSIEDLSSKVPDLRAMGGPKHHEVENGEEVGSDSLVSTDEDEPDVVDAGNATAPEPPGSVTAGSVQRQNGARTMPAPAESEEPGFAEAVTQCVDSMVSNATFSHDLSLERARVQSLINNLVDKVKRGPAEEEPSNVEVPKKEQPLPPGFFNGVPYGDLRSFCVAKSTDHGVELDNDMVWSQTTENVTLTVAVNAEFEVTARDVNVLFHPTALAVTVLGMPRLRERLPHGIDVDGSLWSLDRSNPAAPYLILELEKANQTWWSTLFVSHDPVTYAIHSLKVTQDAHARTKVPPPPPPQEHLEEASATAPPPDTPPPPPSEPKPTHEAAVDEPDRASDEKKESKPARVEGPVRADIEKIVAQYRVAFESGGPSAAEAALQLAAFHHHGVGVKKDDAHAARLYRYALERGALDSSAAFQLGLLYNQGCEGLEANPEEAVRWWTVSAKLGNPVALFNLGVMYMNGSGCTMDPQYAMALFERAHSMNSQLRPPVFTPAQLNERKAQAARQKKIRRKSAVTDPERQRRLADAKDTLRLAFYGSVAVATVGVTAVLVRNWWRNRL